MTTLPLTEALAKLIAEDANSQFEEGKVLDHQSDFDGARRLYLDSLESYLFLVESECYSHERQVPLVFRALGCLETACGQLERARICLAAAVRIYAGLGCSRERAEALIRLAVVYRSSGARKEACECLLEARRSLGGNCDAVLLAEADRELAGIHRE